MKKIQFIDCIRNIWKMKVSFLSIILIAIMGITAFLSIYFTTIALYNNGSELYSSLNFRDVEIVSSMLFSQQDIEDIRAIENVKDVEPIRTTSAKLFYKDNRQNVNVISISERINLTTIIQGRLPVSTNECAIEQKTAEESGLKLGDKISLLNADKSNAKYLLDNSFTVTGIARHADHTNNIVPDLPYVFVDMTAFDRAALDGCYMKVEVVIEKPEKINRFSKKYDNLVAPVIDKIETLSKTAAYRRDSAVRYAAQDKIDKANKSLAEALKKLQDARSRLDEKIKEISNGKTELLSGEKQLAAAKIELNNALKTLQNTQVELTDAKAQIEIQSTELASAKEELDATQAQLETAAAELSNAYSSLETIKHQARTMIKNAYEQIFTSEEDRALIEWADIKTPDIQNPNETARYFYLTDKLKIDFGSESEYFLNQIIDSPDMPDQLLVAFYVFTQQKDVPIKDGDYDVAAIKNALYNISSSSVMGFSSVSESLMNWDEQHDEYISRYSQYKEGVDRYNAGLKALQAAQTGLKNGERQYNQGLVEYQRQKSIYENSLYNISLAKKRIADGNNKIDAGEEEYQKGLVEYNDNKLKLSEQEKQLDDLDQCKWIAYDGRGNASFVQLDVGSSNFSNIKTTFSLLFVVVGALVVFATVGKIVDEQRTQIGTTKALGFFRCEIFAKYLAFGVLATFIGAIISLAAAYFLIEPLMLYGFAKFYYFDISKPAIAVAPSILASVTSMGLAVVAVFLASNKLLREPAVKLMQPKSPGKQKKKGGKSRLSLYSRLIILNMKTDIKRVAVTVASVAGCCALIVIGITLRFSLINAADIQYNEISQYDVSVKYDNDAPGTEAEIEQVLNFAGIEYVKLSNTNATYRIGDLQVAELFCGDIKSIDGFYHIRDWKTGQTFDNIDDGALIQRRIAESYNLDIGSEFEITVGGTKTATVRVAGVFENYIGRSVVMTPKYYDRLFGKEIENNTFFVRTNGKDISGLDAQLKQINGYENMLPSDDGASVVETSVSSVNAVVALFIVMAAVMALVVQLNLTNVYINGKKSELVIMRINGFTVKEVINYVIRETFLTTALGIIFGLGIGASIAYTMIRILEQSFFQFDRSINWMAFIMAAIITVIFTVIINIIALRKVKDFNLTDFS